MERPIMAKDVSVKCGALPYDDGSGFQYNFQIDEQYIWVNDGAVMIDPQEWEAFKNAVDRGLNAFKQIQPS
jgi:hypothetical protein